MVRVVVHCNRHLSNQVESADWLQQGFERHGLDCEITADRNRSADIHVVQGPHYAFDVWLSQSTGRNVLWLDRCFFGHYRYDLSIGWLNADGSRDFKNKNMSFGKGELPELKPKKEGRDCAIVFGDYGMDPKPLVQLARREFGRTYYKPHPAETGQTSPCLAPKWSLSQCWELANVAVGHSSTVLVEAELNGLHVHSTDPHHVCQSTELEGRQVWLNRLSWSQWSMEEIVNGDVWEHLS